MKKCNSLGEQPNKENLILPQHTDTSSNIFIAKDKGELEKLNLSRKSTKTEQQKPKLTKSFKEDDVKPSSLKKVKTNSSEDKNHPQFIKEEITNNEYYDENFDIPPYEKLNRKLFRRERICDTDTEESDSEDENKTRWIILPDNKYKKIWDILIIIIILYSATFTPYNIAFIDSDSDEVIEVIIDVIMWIDLFLNFFTAYTDGEENLVKNRKKIIIKYLKTWFIIDLLSVFPFTQLVKKDNSYVARISKITRLPKFYKVLKLFKILRMTKIKKEGNAITLIKFILDKLKLNANIEKLIYFSLAFFLLSHLSTCIWYFVAKLEDLNPNSWVVRLGYIDSTKLHIYVVSFYWTLTTVTTVGYGDVSAGTTPERIYNLFIMSLGVLMYSFAIGSLSSIVAAMDHKNREMNQKLKILASIRKEYNIDKELYDKVRKVIKFDLSRNQRDKMQFLQELPNKLRIELSQIMHDKAIQNLYFFKDQPSDFFAYVAPLLKPVKFCQNDYLYKFEDRIDESKIIFIFT